MAIDEALMAELREIKATVNPHETLLVADSLTGQDAVRTAEAFHASVSVTGIVLTRLDGDARGGAALSMTQVTGCPIKLVGVGEKLDALEAFDPARMAGEFWIWVMWLRWLKKQQKPLKKKKPCAWLSAWRRVNSI